MTLSMHQSTQEVKKAILIGRYKTCAHGQCKHSETKRYYTLQEHRHIKITNDEISELWLLISGCCKRLIPQSDRSVARFQAHRRFLYYCMSVCSLRKVVALKICTCFLACVWLKAIKAQWYPKRPCREAKSREVRKEGHYA